MTLLVRLRSRSFDRRFARMSFEVIRSRPCLLRLSRPLSLSLWSMHDRVLADTLDATTWSELYVHTVTHQPHTMNGRQQYSTSRPPRHVACRSLIYMVCVNRIDVHSGPGRRDGLSPRSACAAPLHLSPIQKWPKTEAG